MGNINDAGGISSPPRRAKNLPKLGIVKATNVENTTNPDLKTTRTQPKSTTLTLKFQIYKVVKQRNTSREMEQKRSTWNKNSQLFSFDLYSSFESLR